MAPSVLRVAVLGLGPIGRAVSREILDTPDLRLAAAVDPAPSLAGRDLGELLGDARARGVRVVPS
ncbi:MAG: dihydrodipicolinate reductase, partial [bacterium]